MSIRFLLSFAMYFLCFGSLSSVSGSPAAALPWILLTFVRPVQGPLRSRSHGHCNVFVKPRDIQHQPLCPRSLRRYMERNRTPRCGASMRKHGKATSVRWIHDTSLQNCLMLLLHWVRIYYFHPRTRRKDLAIGRLYPIIYRSIEAPKRMLESPKLSRGSRSSKSYNTAYWWSPSIELSERDSTWVW